MRIESILTDNIVLAIKNIFDQSISPNQISLQKTKTEFEGDITLLVFPLIKVSKKSPEETANAIGSYLKENVAEVKAFNVVKGFLNLVIDDSYWMKFLSAIQNEKEFGIKKQDEQSETIMIEFSSPNTNKPLHLGHIRNNLLGHSLAEILKANGKKVIRVNLVNDRGIHICKSMLAWKKWGNGETPESSGMKGDHLVGKYYVLFDQKLKEQKVSPEGGDLEGAIQEMLRKWEAGDKETIDLWKKMNGWVYDGFVKTYKDLGIEFEKTYYESQTYLLGKEVIQDGLNRNIFEKNKEDGSVFIDLTKEKLDKKILLRSDGTSVYMTQDIGTALQRHDEYNFNRFVAVVGNEQEHHFKVLFLILKKLGYEWAQNLFHLSYGMVDLPSGKMKSREGTVVDADDLIAEMIQTAKQKTQELGKADELSPDEAEKLYNMIGLSALKYFILKVEPKKRMLFNPEESIDFNGNTGPFIQYTYARIRSVLRKAEEQTINYQLVAFNCQISNKEKEVLKLVYDFPAVVKEAAESYNPGHIANYVYNLAKEYNQFYHEFSILKAEKQEEKNFRLGLSAKTAEVIKSSFQLLGIDVPERM